MSKILVLQHVPFEILGTLDPLLKSYGVRIKYVNFARRPDTQVRLEPYRGMIVLGGPMSVYERERFPFLETERQLIRQTIDAGLPVLGICLGAQLIAHSLGAEVRPADEKEIGWYDVRPTDEGRRDPLLGNFASSERIFQWHGDTFDLPPGAVHLAWSPGCAQQAFRVGDHVWGLQFHLEVDERLIERWLTVPVHRAEIESLGGRICPDAIRAETPERIARTRQLGEATFRAFIQRLGATRRRPEHPHG